MGRLLKRNIVTLFDKRNCLDFLKYISTEKPKTAFTLGPEGTSCSIAATYLLKTIERYLPDNLIKVEYCENFDDVWNLTMNTPNSFSIVPNAYSGISKFYWTDKLFFIDSFLKDTPFYYLISKDDNAFEKSFPSVSCCHPVQHLIPKLLPKEWEEKYSLVLSSSTFESLEQVLSNKADLGVTNISSIQAMGVKNKVKLLSTPFKTRMLWSIFSLTPPTSM